MFVRLSYAIGIFTLTACMGGVDPDLDLTGASSAGLNQHEMAEVVVTHGYRGILGRNPDPAGLSHHATLLVDGTTVVDFTRGLFGSGEFATHHAQLTSIELATRLYRGILERDPDPTGLAGAVAAIDEGLRAERAAGILESDEFSARFLGGGRLGEPPPVPGDGLEPAVAHVIVAAAYRGILGREANPAGLAGHSANLVAGQPIVELSYGLFASAEFAQNRAQLTAEELAESLYVGILERAPGASGLAVTVEAINAGRRAERAAEILTSPEFCTRFLAGVGSCPGTSGTPVPPGPTVDGATVVAVDLPTELNCNRRRDASVTMRNTGTSTWTADVFRLGPVGDEDPFIVGGSRVPLPGATPVPPGSEVTFHFALRGTGDETTAVTDWRMVHEGIAWFGDVAENTVTVTCLPGPPAGVLFIDLLLRRSGPTWTTHDGAEFDYRQAISCCGEFEDGISGWPIAIAPAWQDYVAAYGANVLHARPGPLLADSEGELIGIGGPYVEVNGKADLTRYNQEFFDVVSGWIYEAGQKGMRVEIDVFDWWRARHGVSGGVPHPWHASHNTQGADYLSGLGRNGHYNAVATAWIRKMVSEWGRFGNVIFQDGTEISLFPNYSAETTWSLRTLVRQFEIELGYPAHMFGSNGTLEAQVGNVDYVTVHGAIERNPIANKPTVLNEYNSTPALAPDQWMLRQCEARAQGTYVAYWRGWRPQTRAEMDETFALWQANDCSFRYEGCLPPGADGGGWGAPVEPSVRGPAMTRAVTEAKAKIPKACGRHPVMTLMLVGYELRKVGYCADQGVDAVSIQAPDGLWEEWHLVAYGTGCWTGSPYKGAWPFDG